MGEYIVFVDLVLSKAVPVHADSLEQAKRIAYDRVADDPHAYIKAADAFVGHKIESAILTDSNVPELL